MSDFTNLRCPISNSTESISFAELGMIPSFKVLYKTQEDSLLCEKYDLNAIYFPMSQLVCTTKALIDGNYTLNNFSVDFNNVINLTSICSIMKLYQFNEICHDISCYHSVASVDTLLRRNGRSIVQVEENRGYVRLIVGKDNYQKNVEVENYKLHEEDYVKTRISLWKHGVKKYILDCKLFLEPLRSTGRKIAVLGNTFQSNLFLNTCNLTHKEIICVIDTDNQGKYIAGTGIQIRGFDALTDDVDYVIVFSLSPKNFIPILSEKKYHGKILSMIPEIREFNCI